MSEAKGSNKAASGGGGGGTTTVANTAARLAVADSLGQQVYQSDNGFFYKQTAADATQAASWTAVPKVYRALLTQAGTAAPAATVLENTLGGTVVWSRTSAGLYLGTLAGAFTVDKTFPQCPSTINAGPTDVAPAGPTYLTLWRNSSDAVLLQTNDGGDFLDISALLSSEPYIALSVLVYP